MTYDMPPRKSVSPQRGGPEQRGSDGHERVEELMSHSVTTRTVRTARVHHSGREGITVAHVREFLADCDAVGIPDHCRVRFEDKLAGEGANRSGYIEASITDDPANY